MANVKVGDLAVVIAAELTPEMIGRIVEVVRQAVRFETFGKCWLDSEELTWVIRPTSGATLPIRTFSGHFHELAERPFSDRFLRPVSGLPETETTDEQIKEPA